MNYKHFQTEHERNKINFEVKRSNKECFLAGLALLTGLLISIAI